MSHFSIPRHHVDWLSLLEISGPFISLPVLLRVFPQGLEPRDAEAAKLLRQAYQEWQDFWYAQHNALLKLPLTELDVLATRLESVDALR